MRREGGKNMRERKEKNRRVISSCRAGVRLCDKWTALFADVRALFRKQSVSKRSTKENGIMLISGLMLPLKGRDEQSPSPHPLGCSPHSSDLAPGVFDRVESLRYPTLCRLFVLRDTSRMLISRYG